MTVSLRRADSVQGSALVTALAITAVLGIALASYLTLVAQQNTMVNRSQAWNRAIAYAEAGVEDGLAQVNVFFGTNSYYASAQANWGLAPAGYYGARTGALAGGFYSAIIVPGGPNPTIVSTGYATVPMRGEVITRTVQITTAPASAFGAAMVALQNVGMNGNNVMVDSYRSDDPAYSTGGLYDFTRRRAGGDVCSAYGLIDVGNAEIYGHVRTSPQGTATVGPQGRVGDLPIIWNGVGQIQDGWYLNDYNANFPDVTPPFTSGWSATWPKNTNTLSLSAGDYYVPGDFEIQNKQTLEITGKVRMYVTGSFTMSGQNGSFLSIKPGASLQLYLGTPSGPPVSATLMTITNAGVAADFQLLGLPSCTSLKWTGNAIYLGCVYAPEADFYLKGSADPKTPFDYQGACVINSCTMDGHFNFHYDEALKDSGPSSGYKVASWREL